MSTSKSHPNSAALVDAPGMNNHRNNNGSGNEFENDDASTVSALTFDHSHFGPIVDTDVKANTNKIKGEKEKATTSSSPPTTLSEYNFTSTSNNNSKANSSSLHHPKTPIISNSKSNRLSNVHEKVISIQKQNKNLKEANLRLMLQMSTSNNTSLKQSMKTQQQEQQSNKQSNPDEETTRRLTKIFEKVQQVQQENELLKNENMELRSFIQSSKHKHYLLNNSALSGIGSSSSDNCHDNNMQVGINYSLEVNAGVYSSVDEQNKSLSFINMTTTSSSDMGTPGGTLNLTTDAIAPTPSPHKILHNLSTDAVILSPPPEKVDPNESLQSMTISELERHKQEYMDIKKQLEDQQRLVREFLEKGFVCQHCKGTYVSNTTKAVSSSSSEDGTQNNNNTIIMDEKETVDKKKRRGLLSRRSNKDDKIQELSQTVTELESKLHKSQIVRGQDVEKITQLGAENIEQRTQIMSLERQVKQSNSIVTTLEQQLETATNEIMDLKDMHMFEKEELQVAYDDLKEETSNLVNWLKDQLSVYQGKSQYAREIALAEEESLESLTKSERDALAREIAEERLKWKEIMDAPGNLFDFKLGRSVASESASIGASTLTTRSPI